MSNELRLELTHHGSKSRVFLNGVDISNCLRGVSVTADVNAPTRAVLEYTGAVVVTGEFGEVEFQQATHYAECSECARVLKGEKRVALVDTTGFSSISRTKAVIEVTQ